MYIQHPAIFENDIIFVNQDAVWLTDRFGKIPQRLTESFSNINGLIFSPDGKKLAFCAENALWVMDIHGSLPEKITHFGVFSKVVAWRDEKTIILSSLYQGILNQFHLFSIDLETKNMQRLKTPSGDLLGSAEFISYGPEKGSVLQVDGYGYESFKGYKGGAAAKLWIDRNGTGDYERFLPTFERKNTVENIHNNLLRPLWIGNRIFFLSDFEGTGNLYSCDEDGKNLQRYSHHKNFYARQSSFYQHTIVYTCGTNLYLLEGEKPHIISIDGPERPLSSYVIDRDPAKDLTSFSLSPNGTQLALATRGQLFKATVHKGPVMQCGVANALRYRSADWTHNGHLLAIYDEGLREEWHHIEKDNHTLSKHTFQTDIGHTISFEVNPKHTSVLSVNHRHEIFLLNFETKEATFIDKSAHSAPKGCHWSPCGRWIVYALASHYHGSSIWLYDTQKKEKTCLVDDRFANANPVFDAEGKYIFFLSARTFTPQWDPLHVHLVCQNPYKIYAISLRKDMASPFLSPFLTEQNVQENLDEKSKEQENTNDKKETPDENKENFDPSAKKEKETIIDLENIEKRIVTFPLKQDTYIWLASLTDKLLYATYCKTEKKASLWTYDFKNLKKECILKDFEKLSLSLDRKTMAYWTDRRLRVVQAGVAPSDAPDESYQKGGWFDWARISLRSCLKKEWGQMFDEVWRLQKEFFWNAQMGSINWENIYTQYKACLEKVRCPSEFIMLLKDMQGELRTSHAYIKLPAQEDPLVRPASLGADLVYDTTHQAYRIEKMICGDMREEHPLLRSDLNLKEGDLIWAIGGRDLSVDLRPEMCLVDQENQIVVLTVGEDKKNISVVPISYRQEQTLRYRAWVEENRRIVHEKSQGKVGYIHIPDMDKWGYAEFIRSFLQEFDREGLIVDARYNGGGNISYLIFDFLRRHRLGYDLSRYQGFMPYPALSPRGPMTALINEHTGSDGDIFARAFKDMEMGLLVGKRTWGGVVGICPRYSLLDGTMTTQPEYAFWFYKVGWGVENYGVDPDIEIDHKPQDPQDRQIEEGLERVLAQIEKDAARHAQERTPPETPDLSVCQLDDDDLESCLDLE